MKGADQCPRCGSRKWIEPAKEGAPPPSNFYSNEVRACINCRTIWEPFDPLELLDPKHEPLGAFLHPCNNCAFRKGSPEQADKEAWWSTMFSLANGAAFYCHKGVPIDPGSEHGFAYPEGGQNPRKLRLCRGYLNSIVGPRLSGRDPLAAKPEAAASAPPVPWVDPIDEPWIDVPEAGA